MSNWSKQAIDEEQAETVALIWSEGFAPGFGG